MIVGIALPGTLSFQLRNMPNDKKNAAEQIFTSTSPVEPVCVTSSCEPDPIFPRF